MINSLVGFKKFCEARDKDNLDMMSLTDLELGVTAKDHDKDVYAGSWFTMPNGKTIAGPSAFKTDQKDGAVKMTPIEYGNKVLQKAAGGGWAKTPKKMPNTPFVLSRQQYIDLVKRGLDQGAGGAGGAGGMPPMGGM